MQAMFGEKGACGSCDTAPKMFFLEKISIFTFFEEYRHKKEAPAAAATQHQNVFLENKHFFEEYRHF